MELIGNLVKNVAIIIIMTSFLEMLLPQETMRRYVRLAMGLFVIVAVLGPVMEVLGKNPQDFAVGAWSSPGRQSGAPRLEAILEDGRRLAEDSRAGFLADYRQRVGKQIQAVAELVPSVRWAEVEVELEEEDERRLGEVRSVVAVVGVEESESSLAGGQVNRIERGDDAAGGSGAMLDRIEINWEAEARKEAVAEEGFAMAVTTEVRNVIGNFYNIAPDRIEVVAVRADNLDRRLMDREKAGMDRVP